MTALDGIAEDGNRREQLRLPPIALAQQPIAMDDQDLFSISGSRAGSLQHDSLEDVINQLQPPSPLRVHLEAHIKNMPSVFLTTLAATFSMLG